MAKRPQPPEPPRLPGGRLPRLYLALFLAGSALAAGYMWHYIASERRVALEHWRARVSTMADANARVVSEWLETRRADAELLANLPTLRALLASGTAAEEASSPRFEPDGPAMQHLERVAEAYGYKSVLVLTPRGRVVAKSSAGARAEPQDVEAAKTAAKNRKVGIDLSIGVPGKTDPLLRMTVPVLAGLEDKLSGSSARPVLGSVMLRMDPAHGLFRVLGENNTTSTGETVLFSYAQEVTYLSPLRFQIGGWATVKRSLEAVSTLAARKAVGEQNPYAEVTDYREAPVLAAVRWIPLSGWGLLFKIDRDEALREFHQAGKMGSLTAGFLIVAYAGVLFSFWRQRQRAELLKEQMRQERAIFGLKGYADKIVASVPSGLLVLAGDLRILSANRAFLESFSTGIDRVVGRGLHDVIRAPGLQTRVKEVLDSGLPQQDLPFDLQVGTERVTRPVRITVTGVRMTDEDEARLLVIVQDLTEEERLNAARQASEQRFRDLVQGLDAIVWEADAGTLRFSFVSQRAEDILGFPVERWLRERDFWTTRIHAEDRERALEIARTATAERKDHEFEYRSMTADGRVVWLRDIVHVVGDSTGSPRQLRGVTVDVTERRQAEEALALSEEQLRQAQKMRAVGQLAGGIAHDFNNLLMVIRGESDLILRRLTAEDPMRRNAEGIREAADQAATLTRQLLAFSRKQVLAPKVVDLNEILAGMQAMLQRLLGETINLVTRPGSDLGHVKADPGQIEQVVMNLAVNSRDAMPDGGQLIIETSNVEFDEKASRLQDGVTPGRYVMLAVTDTGCGMDAETQAHLFEPFFTTKQPGKGTGLGLSTVYGIVKQSGGHVWVYTEQGRGTTFKICFPLADHAAAAIEAAEPAVEVERGAETILLVEDAHRVREVVREILAMNGYKVLEARHGPEALEISEHHPSRIHLMVTDVVMPGMSGRELSQRLTPMRPDMKVLYMSGYTDDAIVRHGVLAQGMAFLSKPFTPDSLALKVREVLDTPQSGFPLDGLGPSRPGPAQHGRTLAVTTAGRS